LDNSSKSFSTGFNSRAKIFRATRDGHVSYTSPAEFQEFPAVVQPSSLEHQQLCDKIPGLYHFDPKLMPISLMNSEKSFHNEESFYRFVRALRALAGPSGIGLFVKTHLGLTDLKVTFP
jgi:sacsin